ncbi:hypothetical protein CRG98_032683 [Punica granatum]|uniref:C3H1-type domain-containing protein n=1 Tax=Punica granatum TaxID=22663 RepID=A0A2I0ISA3_PUNGR|nr:hypothetical protein CRG98_032683 [Punica granatum]
MDYGPESGNVVHVIPEPWASEEEYRIWNGTDTPSDTPSNSNHDQRQSQSQTRSGSEPPSKKSKGTTLDSASSGNSRSKAIGKMFFKTKLCCKFRSGTCPYITNCNFAHSIEELRRPPPNWQEIVAAADDEEREEFQIPSVGSVGFNGDSQRSYKGRHCKKFYTEEGCPYGDNCTFLHDEQSKNRESVAISLGPGGYSGGGGELHRYGGGLLELESRDASSVPPDAKQGGGGVPMKALTDNEVTAVNSVPHLDVYHMGVPSQRTAIILQRPGQRAHQKWKGPDKISRIYGDWIDDIE